MLRKRPAEPVTPIGRATDGEAARLRGQCALACLTHIGAIVDAYDKAPDALEREGIDDRAVDLWSPLLALATVADAEDRGKRVPQMLAAAKALGALRDADAEGGSTAVLLDALDAVRTKIGQCAGDGAEPAGDRPSPAVEPWRAPVGLRAGPRAAGRPQGPVRRFRPSQRRFIR